MDIILKSYEYKEFIKASKISSSYFKINTPEPNDICRDYLISLDNYRKFLDDLGYKMPNQIYPYNKKDKSTWKYSDCLINGLKCKDILNENWKYNK